MSHASGKLGRFRSVYALGILCGATFALGLVATRSSADPKPDQRTDREVTLAIVRDMREHLSHHPLDQEISNRTFDLFFKSLDPMKVYFTQADIDEFAKSRNDLGTMLKKGDISFAYQVFDRLLKRTDERVALADEILKGDIDFTVDETIVTDPKLTTYAKNDTEVKDKWRKLIKYELLMKKLDKIEGQEAHDKVSRHFHSIAKLRHQQTGDDLLEIYLTAMTQSYDPHTDYMSPSTEESFDIAMRLSLEGIGAKLQYDDGNTKITELVPGGAASKDGRLKPGDKIMAVGQGRDGDIVDVGDMNINEVVKLIRGKAGTLVRLKVMPAAGNEPKVIDITRASIELTDSAARSEVLNANDLDTILGKKDAPPKADDSAKNGSAKDDTVKPVAKNETKDDNVIRTAILENSTKPDGRPYKIGVIDLPSFYMDMKGNRAGVQNFRSTSRDLDEILRDFKAKGVDAVILDLRRNGGGALNEAIAVTGLFIDEGPVVQVKDSNGRVQHLDDEDKGVAWDGPLVVMQSKFSASASEIFTGAIQDYARGLIVGDKTSHGKGTVQSMEYLAQQLFPGLNNAPSLGALKITIQQFYRPDGDSTQNRGVVSDVELPSITSHLDVGESDLDYALKFDKVDPAPYAKVNMVDKQTVDQLRKASTQRVAKSEDFQKVQKKIDRYIELKAKKETSLNEEKFMAERSDFNTDKEEEKEFEQLDESDRPVVKHDYYFDEVLAITLDYIHLLNGTPSNVASGAPQPTGAPVTSGVR